MEQALGRRCFAEALGTFALVFCGTGAIVVDALHAGAIGHAGISAVFGLVVLAMIYAVGDVSGAHLNPAVTLGFWVARRFPAGDVGPYVASQCAGALAASGLLRAFFGTPASLGATLPAGAVAPAFALEIALTGLLVFVILCVSTGAKERGVTAGIAIGATVALGALFGGPVSGASMNPARSLGPALVSGQLAGLWIYLAAPALGAAVAVGACRFAREPGCCAPLVEAPE